MNSYNLTYFAPSAPQQAIPGVPVALTEIQADRFIYEDGVVLFVKNNDANPREPEVVLAVPLELMPIIYNMGPVPE